MSITIRELQAADKQSWKHLFDAYADFYSVILPDDCSDDVWSWIFDDNEPFWCSVAVNEQDKPVGFVQYQLMHRSLGGSKVCYLSDLFVDPHCRQSGTGKALIDHVIGFAKQKGIVNVRWLTQQSNHTAKRLYETYVAQSEFVLYSLPVDNG